MRALKTWIPDSRVCLTAVAVGLLTVACTEPQFDAELLLRRIAQQSALRPLSTKPLIESPKYLLGRALFFDPVLSGQRDVACATCHVPELATTDGRSAPVTPGSVQRALNRPPRNTPDLFNRDHDSVTHLFWDGRAEARQHSGKILLRSPQGEFTRGSLDNVLALQALTPLTTPDEMLGRATNRSSAELPSDHAGHVNELAVGPMPESAAQSLERLIDRLLGRRETAPVAWQLEYRKLFQSAYPDRTLEQYTFADIANALAHFEELAFATRSTRWDRYLQGEDSALSQREKRGAILFFGRGRCGVCHAGPLFSDFRFHSIGVAQTDAQDVGRSDVTSREADKYKFRTPPLRNVTLTGPYFHDGSATTLVDAVRQHVRPLARADRYESSGVRSMSVPLIESVSEVLLLPVPLREDEVLLIVTFLQCLQDGDALALSKLRPSTVPSGLVAGVR